MGPKLLDTAMWNAGIFNNRLFGQYGEEGGRSGVVRLWMYDLYAESIAQDHKTRIFEENIAENQVEVLPEAKNILISGQYGQNPQQVTQKPKQRRTRRGAAKLEANVTRKPLPRYAPVFVKPIDSPSISEYLAELSPLPILKDYIKETAVAKKRKAKRKQDDEWLLLMAA